MQSAAFCGYYDVTPSLEDNNPPVNIVIIVKIVIIDTIPKEYISENGFHAKNRIEVESTGGVDPASCRMAGRSRLSNRLKFEWLWDGVLPEW